MSTGKWDFYLCSGEDKFLEFALMEYRLDCGINEIPEPHDEMMVVFAYQVEPRLLHKKPKGQSFDIEEFLSIFYESEIFNPGRYKSPEITIRCTQSGKEIIVDASSDIEDIVEELGTETGELEIVYGSWLNIMNPMAHLIYWMQLKEKAPKNLFFGMEEDRDVMYWAVYSEEKQRIEFKVDREHRIKPYDKMELTNTGLLMDEQWYDFEYFDYVRAISRWIDYDKVNCYGDMEITVKYLTGKTKTYSLADDYEDFFAEMGADDAGIAEAYIPDIDRDFIVDFITYNYEFTHGLFILPIRKDRFINEYHNIPAIADNETIVEMIQK